jgi:hypothetical protein
MSADRKMGRIPVLYSFARSGGTLVNQLLGVHPQCLVLSEVNPAASYKPVAEQAVEWLGLVEPAEAAAFAALPYARQIASLHERAAGKGKRLVVRDWVTVNFLPGVALADTEPSRQLEQEMYLERAGLEPVPLVVSRRSMAVYRSITHRFAHLGKLDMEAFAVSYLEYARRVAGFARVQLEALRSRPAAALGEILASLGLDDHDRESLLASFHEFRRCTGNTTLQAAGGSADAKRVLPPDESADVRDAQLPPAMAEADRLMGYA